MKKQFLVLGLGRFGSSLAAELCTQGHEVLAVDVRGERVADMAPRVTQAVQADATDEEALEALGVQHFDAAMVAIGQNIRDSVLISVLCKEKGVPLVMAKAVDSLHAKVLEKVGVDRVVFPEQEMGVRVAKSLVSPSILDLMELADGYQIAELRVPRSWVKRSLTDLQVRRKYGLSVIGIRKSGGFLPSPGPEMVFETDDMMVVLGRHRDVEALERP